MDDNQQAQKYGIKIVAKQTGLSPHVIRIWEKRYNAVSPGRTETNRRLYSEEDVARLQLLHELTLSGHAIGQIAQLPTQDLKLMLRPSEKIAKSARVLASAPAGEQAVQNYLDVCITAVKQLDADALELALARAAVTLSQPVLIEQLIVPLMNRIGDLWRDGTLRVIHEHMATAVVRSFLGTIPSAFEVPAAAPSLIVTTPVGQLHELGALIAAATASSEGWRVTYLGPNLPAEEIAAGAMQNQARAIGLSIIYPSDDVRMLQEFTKLRRALSADVALLVGGRAAEAYREIWESVGAIRIRDMQSFRTVLEALRLRQPI